MGSKLLATLAVVLAWSATAAAGEMDRDRPGTATKVLIAPATPLAAATEMDRESPAQACFFYRPFWGWYRPFGFGFNSLYFFNYSYFYNSSFFYRPFFPTVMWPYYLPGWGFDPTLIYW